MLLSAHTPCLRVCVSASPPVRQDGPMLKDSFLRHLSAERQKTRGFLPSESGILLHLQAQCHLFKYLLPLIYCFFNGKPFLEKVECSQGRWFRKTKPVCWPGASGSGLSRPAQARSVQRHAGPGGAEAGWSRRGGRREPSRAEPTRAGAAQAPRRCSRCSRCSRCARARCPGSPQVRARARCPGFPDNLGKKTSWKEDEVPYRHRCDCSPFISGLW